MPNPIRKRQTTNFVSFVSCIEMASALCLCVFIAVELNSKCCNSKQKKQQAKKLTKRSTTTNEGRDPAGSKTKQKVKKSKSGIRSGGQHNCHQMKTKNFKASRALLEAIASGETNSAKLNTAVYQTLSRLTNNTKTRKKPCKVSHSTTRAQDFSVQLAA